MHAPLADAPQADASQVELLETAEARAEIARAREIARALGLKEVGWAYAHPPRVAGFTAYELSKMCAAQTAATADEEEAATLFVSVRFRPVYENEPIEGEVTAEGVWLEWRAGRDDKVCG